ncbi:MAG: class I tRNA ligase family protein, partial [Proteobacteria bacterium]|nr:class I tRNA ligase family protein [Pseudomonadota bacterium]
ILSNEFINAKTVNTDSVRQFVLLLSPFAPHMSEELWQRLGEKETLAYEPWPEYDESKLVKTEYELPVQINGKMRDSIQVPMESDQNAVLNLAKESSKVQKHIEGKSIVKVIFVKNKILNIVVR